MKTDKSTQADTPTVEHPLGFDVCLAKADLEAFRILQAQPIGLILLDLSLLEGTVIVRTFARFGIPILALVDRAQGREALLEAGATGVLQKPFEVKRLVTKVQNLLDGIPVARRKAKGL